MGNCEDSQGVAGIFCASNQLLDARVSWFMPFISEFLTIDNWTRTIFLAMLQSREAIDATEQKMRRKVVRTQHWENRASSQF
jgi:hypothetical protein